MNNGSLRVAWDNSLAKRNPTGTGVYANQLIRELAAKPGVTLEVYEGWDPARRKPGEFGSHGILARGAFSPERNLTRSIAAGPGF